MGLSRNRIPQKAQIELSISRSPWCRLCLLSCRGGLQSTKPQTKKGIAQDAPSCCMMSGHVFLVTLPSLPAKPLEKFNDILGFTWSYSYYVSLHVKKHLVKCMISVTVWSQLDVAPLLRFQDVVPLIWIGDWTNEVPWFATWVCLKMGVPENC